MTVAASGVGRAFAPLAGRLAGLAGWHLGWSADAFWEATPEEMAAVVRVMLGADGEMGAGMGPGGGVPPGPETLARLREMFPDG